MIRIALGLFLIAMTTLVLELSLIRVFDVIWRPNMAYMVITLAMFCFALAGVFFSMRPIKDVARVPKDLAIIAALFALSALALLPGVNHLPFHVNLFETSPVKGFFLFFLLYILLALPFFLAGLIITGIFANYSEKIQQLYFWDLVGAGIGCVVLIPFLPHIGPGGLLFVIFAGGMIASGLFSGSRTWLIVSVVAGLLVGSVPFFKDGYYDFRYLVAKRALQVELAQGRLEGSYWDPISRIDVFKNNGRKDVFYDGGNQITLIISFDGDYKNLREKLSSDTLHYVTHPGVIASHYLKKDTGAKVLIIGAAGGQETKTALAYGASHVDAIELVGQVIKLGKENYKDFNGGIYLDPRVNARKGEGRSFMKASGKTYDIIQMFSNHTSSSIAGGNGAMSPLYLQTVEAYEDYFKHLNKDGILHINHHVYPKMVLTAAKAWKKLGRKDFAKHVLIYESETKGFQDNLPTMLIKMSPWTPEEVAVIDNETLLGQIDKVVDPIHPEKSYLSAAFFEGELPDSVIRNAKYQIEAPTDDKPFFNFLRKDFGKLDSDPSTFLNFSTASLLNSQQTGIGIPRDVLHLFVTGGAAVVFMMLFLMLPLMFSRAGKTKWPARAATLSYFAALGAGFIIVELIMIQLFMKLIGYPLYTYSAMVFALLISAGIGSWSSEKMGISPQNRWTLPFVMTVVLGMVLVLVHQPVFDLFLQSSLPVRVLVSVLMVFPLGFFMGMPLPLGIMSITVEKRSAIPWAWAMNGLFTVVGGFLSVIISIFYGFQVTIMVALAVYVLAMWLFSKMRQASLQAA